MDRRKAALVLITIVTSAAIASSLAMLTESAEPSGGSETSDDPYRTIFNDHHLLYALIVGLALVKVVVLAFIIT